MNHELNPVGSVEASLLLQCRAMESSAVGVCIADALAPDLPLIYVNPAFERISGYGRAEIIGRNCRFLQGADREQPALKTLRDAIKQGQAANVLLRNYRKNGDLFWNELSITPVYGADGVLTHFIGMMQDVTRRIEAEVALKESEERFRYMANAAPALIWLSDVHNLGIWFNRRWLEYTGRTMEQELGLGWAAGVHPDDLDRSVEYCNQAFAARRQFEMEFRLRRADGSYGWIADTGIPCFSANGEFEGYIGYCWDITDRKRVEEALRRKRNFVSTLVETANVLWVVLDRHGRIVSFNRACEEATGYTFAELQGKYVWDYLLLPEEQKVVRQVFDALRFDAIPSTFENYWIGKQGQKCLVQWSNSVMPDARGEVEYITAVGIDVAQRRRAEAEIARFKNTLDQTLDCVFMFEPDTLRFFYVNQGAVAHIGYTERELLQMHPYDIKPEYSERQFREFIAPMLSGARSSMTFETVHKRHDGRVVPVEIFLQYIAPTGESPRFVAIVRDIAERKKVDRLKDEFISVVSHELRTPLTSIRGALGLLAGGALDGVPENIRSMVDIAYRNSERLSSLIDDILDIEKIASGKMKFDLQPHSLRDLLQQAVRMNQGFAVRYGVEYQVAAIDDEITIKVDRGRFQQVMANLLSNAAKFSPSGEVVRVTAVECEGKVRIAISDQGPGIAPEFRKDIFKKFSQADGSDTRQKTGTGLGLAISKEIVERMGGDIGYESDEGRGATFYVTFPVANK